MASKIYLNIVESLETDTTLLVDKLPAFTGEEDENLACGACKNVIGRNVSTRSLYERFAVPSRLIVRCLCGAHNAIPSQRVP